MKFKKIIFSLFLSGFLLLYYANTANAAEFKNIFNNVVAKYHDKKALIDYLLKSDNFYGQIKLENSDQELQLFILKNIENKIKTSYSIETTAKNIEKNQIVNIISKWPGKISFDKECINIPDKTYKLNNKNYSLFNLKYYPKSKQLHFRLIFFPYFGSTNEDSKIKELPKIFHQYTPLIDMQTIADECLKYQHIKIESSLRRLTIDEDKCNDKSAIDVKIEHQKSAIIIFYLYYSKAQTNIFKNLHNEIQGNYEIQKLGDYYYSLPKEKVLLVYKESDLDDGRVIKIIIDDIKNIAELKKQIATEKQKNKKIQQKSTTTKDKPTVKKTKKCKADGHDSPAKSE